MMELPPGSYRFDQFVLDSLNLRLTANGASRPLEPKSFRLLQFLIENRHRVVSKDEILRVVWEDVAVTDNALTRAVAQIRKALDDDPKQARFIETVPTVGYRFAGQVIEQVVPLSLAPLPDPKKFSPRLVATTAMALLAIVSGGVWLAKQSSQTPRRVVAIRQITKSAGADFWPSFSPDGSHIAFSSNRSGLYEIYVRSLAPDGAEHQITADRQENIEPAWSPDGQYLAYVPRQHGGIRIIPASGGPARDLTDSGDSPQWAPNGRTLAIRLFGGNQNPSPDASAPSSAGPILSLIDAEGGPARPLTEKGADPLNPSFPCWLADGRHIVFASKSPGPLGSGLAGLWVVDSQTRGLSILHAGTLPQYPVFSPDGRDLYFADEAAKVPGIWHARMGRNWAIESTEPLIPSGGAYSVHLNLSADGSRIAFSRRAGESAIWSVPLDSRGVAAGEPKPLIRDRSFRNHDAHVSADGSKIVWTSFRADYSAEIYVANADGSSAAAVTPADQISGRPEWVGKELTLAYLVQKNGEWSYWVAPLQGRPERVLTALDLKHADRSRLSSDGTMLAAQVTTPGGLQVVVAGLRGGAVRILTPAARNIGFPCWSPDGHWIAAEERVHGDTTLVVLPSAGGEIRTVAKELSQYFPYDWSPDSSRIVFAGLSHGVWNIYWISVSTGKVEQLTHFTSQFGSVRYPAWSPKGDQILFEHNDLTSNIYIADLHSRNK
jgi:Tol biopolymer transport system component/DNA-binding winged helix-turn-helix (wHTH) protein